MGQRPRRGHRYYTRLIGSSINSTYVKTIPDSTIFRVGDKRELPGRLNEEIRNLWDMMRAADPSLVDGPIFSADKISQSSQDGVVISIHPTNFSHYLYSQTASLKNVDKCRSVAVNVLMRTTDNFLVLAKMYQGSIFRDKVKMIGGAVHPSDIQDRILNPLICLYRETKEEIGCDLAEIMNEIRSVHIVTRPQSNIFNICYEVDLKVSRHQLTALVNYDSAGDQEGTKEVETLVFIESTTALENFQKDGTIDSVDYVIPYLRVIDGIETALPLMEEFFEN